MTDTSENPRVAIGDNAPPMTPLESHTANIEDLMMEAQNHLDGEPIETQGQADAVGTLLDSIRKARGAADEQRKVEKKPHDDAGKAVQAVWVPLISKCDTAAETAKKALAPYLAKLQEEQRKVAQEERDKAIAAQQEALDAQRAASASSDLAAQERAKELTKASERAVSAANRAEKAKPLVAGGARSVGLRTVYTVELTAPLDFGRWLWANRPDVYLEFLTEQAKAECRNGEKRPGVLVKQEQIV